MTNEQSTAIYLVGQGTYYRPRLLEVQHNRISRYLRLVATTEPERFRVKNTYVDLHARFQSSDSPILSDFPQLVMLCEAIKRGDYSNVLIDLEFHRGMGAIEWTIKEAGAKVINVSHDAEIVHEAYSKRVVPSADSHPSDASDFIAFFPHAAADIGQILNSELGREDHKGLRERLERLVARHPTAAESYSIHLCPPWWEI
jgi:hypothetical protein